MPVVAFTGAKVPTRGSRDDTAGRRGNGRVVMASWLRGPRRMRSRRERRKAAGERLAARRTDEAKE